MKHIGRYDLLNAGHAVSDVAPVADAVTGFGRRLEFAELHNSTVPKQGVEQISFQINRSVDYPTPLVAGLLKLHERAQDIGMAIQASREAQMEAPALAAARPAIKATFNPKLGM